MTRALAEGFTVVLGGDCSLVAGTVAGARRHFGRARGPRLPRRRRRPQHARDHALRATCTGWPSPWPSAAAPPRSPRPWARPPSLPDHVSLVGFRALDPGERAPLGDLGLALPAAAARGWACAPSAALALDGVGNERRADRGPPRRGRDRPRARCRPRARSPPAPALASAGGLGLADRAPGLAPRGGPRGAASTTLTTTTRPSPAAAGSWSSWPGPWPGTSGAELPLSGLARHVSPGPSAHAAPRGRRPRPSMRAGEARWPSAKRMTVENRMLRSSMHGAEREGLAAEGLPTSCAPGHDVAALHAVRGVLVLVDLARQVKAHGHQARRGGAPGARPLPGAAASSRPGAGARPRGAGRSRGRGRPPDAGQLVHVVEVGGHEQVALAAAARDRHAAHAQPGLLEERPGRLAGGRALGILGAAEALEGHPERGPPGDVHAARAVGAQPELVLVLVDEAAAEGRGEEEDRREAGAAWAILRGHIST